MSSKVTILSIPVPSPAKGDFNGDGRVTRADLFMAMLNYGKPKPLGGMFGFKDFWAVCRNFGRRFTKDFTWYTTTPQHLPTGSVVNPVAIFSGYNMLKNKRNADDSIDTDRVPDRGWIEQFIARSVTHNRVILDIECASTWPHVVWGGVSEDDVKGTVRRYVELIAMIRELSPGIQIGSYRYPPVSTLKLSWLFSPTLRPIWEDNNVLLSPIADALDWVCPSLYMRDGSVRDWVRGATETIIAARQYGKPVFGYLMPQWHPNNEEEGCEWLPGDIWERQVALVQELCDGAIIYRMNDKSIGKRGVEKFSPELPWWQTMEAQKGLI